MTLAIAIVALVLALLSFFVVAVPLAVVYRRIRRVRRARA